MKGAMALQYAIVLGHRFCSGTSPNPPVGAVLLDVYGNVIGFGAHQRAGEAHAERLALEDAKHRGTIGAAYAMAVSLEPCCHVGRQPPCVDLLVANGIKEVFIGCLDVDSRVSGNGVKALRAHGIQVHVAASATQTAYKARHLIRQFSKRVQTGRPWILVKAAFDAEGSMVPPVGQSTFSSQRSLRYGHYLRKRSDGIISTWATAVADQPRFTVRHVDDVVKNRKLILFGQPKWDEISLDLKRIWSQRFSEVISPQVSWDEAWKDDSLWIDANEFLVEAGPKFLAELLSVGCVDEILTIQALKGGKEIWARRVRGE